MSLHNRKLIDCNIHLNDSRGVEEKKLASSIFLTEGDSAGGSITKVRDADPRPCLCCEASHSTPTAPPSVCCMRKEFNLLQAALNLEDGIDGLRYNNVIIATDADVDGMHIRLRSQPSSSRKYFPTLSRRAMCICVADSAVFCAADKRGLRYWLARGVALPLSSP